MIFSYSNINEHRYEVIKQIDFNTGFIDLNFSFCGLFTDKSTNQEFIYLTDPISKKCVKFFDINACLIDSIPLSESLSHFKGNDIGGITPFSKDTIIINSRYTNKIIAINNKGNIWYNLDIDSIITDTAKFNYEFYASYWPNTTNNTLLFRAWPKYRNLISKGDHKKELNKQEEKIYFYSQFYERDYFLKIENFLTDSISSNFCTKKLYKNIYNKGERLDISHFFKYINKYIYLISRDTDNIFVIDSGKIKKIKIKSDYTTIGAKPYKISNDVNVYENQEKKYWKEVLHMGMINNIYYNKNTNEFYIIVQHSLKNETELNKYGEMGKYRAFSVIVCNKNLEKKYEYKFDGNLYNSRVSIMTEQGLLILKKDINQNINNYGKQSFDLLKFY